MHKQDPLFPQFSLFSSHPFPPHPFPPSLPPPPPHYSKKKNLNLIPQAPCRGSSTGHMILASTSLASITLQCSIRLSLLRTLSHYRLELLAFASLLLLISQINLRLKQRRVDNALVTKYVHIALRILARKAALPAGGAGDVPVVQLRDQVLQHEFDPERRKRLWEGVQRVVECNSNVRAASKEVHGEVLRCWTWIGGLLEQDQDSEASVGGLNKKQDLEMDKIDFPRVIA